MKLRRELLSFGVVGVIGFVVDVAVLYALERWLGWYGARVLSFWAAASCTWALNRRFTFAPRASAAGSVAGEYALYLLSMLGGAALNYAAYVATLHTVEGAFAPALGVALGSGAGMTINFLSARYLVFGVRRRS